MNQHLLSLGAINKKTGKYICPKLANKKDEHICVECQRYLILCQGNIRIHHFRHHTDIVNQCNYYNSPTESQIHKDAKLLIKMLLDGKIPTSFIRNCACCNKKDEFEIPEITETSIIQIEYRFDYNGVKIADVAYIDNNELVCIFEIYNTHKTDRKNRPEPWFEIDAQILLTMVNGNSNILHGIKIQCIRREKCDNCMEKEKRRAEIEKEKAENKNKAVNILYDWLKDGQEIVPFTPLNISNGFGKIVKTEGEIYDLIIYSEYNYDDNEYCGCIDYYIQLTYTHNHYNFTKEEKDSAESRIAIYYIDVNWVLSQTETPKRIDYLAGLDKFVDDYEVYCSKCNGDIPLWVKRINPTTDFIIINVGCECGHNANTEYADCIRCGENNTPLCVMQTNIYPLLCKNCDIETYSMVLFDVPYSEKDEIKKYGAFFDKLYKKWFVPKYNKNIETIRARWKEWKPTSWYRSVSHP